jgi:hypothetical protein
MSKDVFSLSPLTLSGYYKSRKHIEQLSKEATWILHNLAEEKRKLAAGKGNIEKYNKVLQKWFNWSKAHPKEAKQIESQLKEL